MITADRGASPPIWALSTRLAQPVTSSQLDELPRQAAFDKVTSGCPSTARVAPEHKLKIVESLQRQGNIVAMTDLA